jgi:hypothetical protein
MVVYKKPRSKAGKKQIRKVTKGYKKKAKALKKTAKTKVISRRGREHPMAAPSAGMPTTAQNVFNESTVIESFKYKGDLLRIFFQSGHIYDYFNVPAYTVQLLEEAPSKGHYFYYNIRTSFTFRRVK